MSKNFQVLSSDKVGFLAEEGYVVFRNRFCESSVASRLGKL